MNKLILYILLLSILGCRLKKENILIHQSNVDYKIQIRSSNKNRSDIVSIRFPKKIIIKNSNNSITSFKTINYQYYDSLSNWANRNVKLYEVKNKELEKISNFKKKIIKSKQNATYIFYTMHFLDSTKSIQQQFKPYIEKILKENKDTLYIGTVAEFKKKHKELFEKLTKNDSISIQFLDGKKLGERITVPVEW